MYLRPLRPLLAFLVVALQITSCANETGPTGELPPATETPHGTETPQTEGDGASGTITVDPGKKYQTIDGFGTTMGMFDSPHLNGSDKFDSGGLVVTEAQKDTIYDLLYSRSKGIGLNRLRVHLVTPGWQPEEGARIVTDAGYPQTGPAVLDFIQRALLRNPSLRTGFQIGEFDRWITRTTPPIEVARYIKTGLDYARLNGHVPDWVGILNEPSLAPIGFSPESLRDITIALKSLLEADGYSIKGSAPDDVVDGLGAPKAAVILADPQARSFIKSLSIHLYGDLSPTEMAALAKQYGLPLWMTEFDDRDGRGLSWATNIVHEMLVTYDCAAVDMLFGFIPSAGFGNPYAAYITLNSRGTAYEGYVRNLSYYQTGHWSRYVIRGSVRIGAESSNPEIKVSAFLVEGKKVLVLINTSNSSKNLAIPGGDYRVIRTQASGPDRLADKGVFTARITLPPSSMVTLVER